MLERPPDKARRSRSDTPAANRKRRSHPLSTSPGAIRSRRWRARRERGKAVVEVEFDDGVVGLLVRHGWLGGDEVAEAREVGRDRRDVERGGPR
jgi:hypothetical protein